MRASHLARSMGNAPELPRCCALAETAQPCLLPCSGLAWAHGPFVCALLAFPPRSLCPVFGDNSPTSGGSQRAGPPLVACRGRHADRAGGPTRQTRPLTHNRFNSLG